MKLLEDEVSAFVSINQGSKDLFVILFDMIKN